MAPALRHLLLAAALATLSVAKPLVATNKNWDSVDWDAAEKELEEGDDPELLLSEDAAALAELERRKAAGVVLPDDDVRLKDPTEWVRHTNAMTGPTMLFVTLRDSASPDGKPWASQPKAAFEELTGRWRELLKTDGIEAACYEIGEGRVLVSLHSGWRGYDVRDFILAQREVEELEWDNVKYHPGEALPARPRDMKQAAAGKSKGGKKGRKGAAAAGPLGGVAAQMMQDGANDGAAAGPTSGSGSAAGGGASGRKASSSSSSSSASAGGGSAKGSGSKKAGAGKKGSSGSSGSAGGAAAGGGGEARADL